MKGEYEEKRRSGNKENWREGEASSRKRNRRKRSRNGMKKKLRRPTQEMREGEVGSLGLLQLKGQAGKGKS